MKLTKTIFLNNKKINTFEAEQEQAEIELFNLLISKTQNRYKIQIQFDHITRTIKANLYFSHELASGQINKYKYNYFFSEVKDKIYL
jgi:hypothetical protein